MNFVFYLWIIEVPKILYKGGGSNGVISNPYRKFSS